MLANPEFARNVRSQLRPAKVVIAAVIIGAMSLVLVFALTHLSIPAAGPSGWGFGLLHLLFWLQALILAAGGGIACVNAIYKEKDQNTFDFQRVTRLSPLELAVGKLFGAPIFMYLLCLYLVPIVIFAAIKGHQSFSFILAAYAVLLIGSLAFHALSLLISLLTVRGSHTTAIIFVLVILGIISSAPTGISYFFQLGSLSPFYATQVAMQRNWAGPTFLLPFAEEIGLASSSTGDVFFGYTVRHITVMIAIDAVLIAWFLLALARNIKRDPDQYELYSPLQSLGIVAFLNFVLLAFVNWRSADLLDIQATLLTINGAILGTIGLAQLRNRDRMRRILRTKNSNTPSWVDLTWPAPFLFVASAGASILMSVAAAFARNTQIEWSWAFNIFRALFFAAWIVRDTQFLQWMTLRRGKRPLVIGILYLAVFYACAWIVLSSFGTFRDVDKLPFTAFLLPTPIYYLDHAAWAMRPAIWGAAFIAQWFLIGLFVFAQRKTILELARPTILGAIPAATD
jgi:hypothetical protein